MSNNPNNEQHKYPKEPIISHRNCSSTQIKGKIQFEISFYCSAFHFSILLSSSSFSFHYVSFMRVSMFNFQVFHFTLAIIALLVTSGSKKNLKATGEFANAKKKCLDRTLFCWSIWLIRNNFNLHFIFDVVADFCCCF